ncbi:hypothetical protein N7448_002634 [Penicillium atrosanguineum]|uniref:FAD/NAD(P)-binding domain-containing protein n=1 Tax=Penicillium atrosanguineum TaxID=1132637 RepID=A0A9W9LAJ2_9EURO|nr:Pre-mRNA-splicing ATP-dependent RNA helicase prp28 [Penicillium atrosanguineum]KAJ5128926.1 hypothetical protein N7526_007092 [Penicillium atrosanguineum]KAJ5145242.1 hypothetical protein N7448_002634 [Penicillium atrosanguineum]KAJ5301037.1 Pre-mRNA-splicing ATP-dependent RNA helicase prp28 [Penicillium atrosanguineum]KAJ5311682.1 hypothetical protein N7476_007542 [Penicillium atrosanguineum]
MPVSDNRPFSKVIVIGAGFSGLAMACQLQRKLNCDDYTIYDRSAAPGGAWWANKYPGCAVDIPAVFYSLSFAPNPDFSKVFPPQAEILEYFNGVAKKFDVSRHIVSNTEWEGAYWQEKSKIWLVKLKDLLTGGIFYQECQVLVSAVGGLVNPNLFNLPGVETFQGDIIHTARWKENISFQQKDVIVVGNGCSAAQLVPAISNEAKSVTQFIRTPQHYLHNENIQVSDTWRFIFRHMPIALWILRVVVFLYLEGTAARFNMDANGIKARKASADRSEAYIKRTAPEKYWPLLIPKFEIGCKRRVFDTTKYIGCLQQDNIHLTDDPIVGVQPHSILTQSGQEHSADTILLATGFSLTQYDVELIGRDGRTREDHWDEYGYKEAYKSIAMSGFPNFFYILGPNSGKGHTSTIYSIENYVDLVVTAITPVIKEHSSFVEVKPDSERLYNERLHESITKTVFNTSCGSVSHFYNFFACLRKRVDQEMQYFIDQKSQKNWFIYPWSSFAMWYSTHWDRADDWVYDVSSPKLSNNMQSLTKFSSRPNLAKRNGCSELVSQH